MPLKLVSVNIERSFHLPLAERFFADADADVICVQELIREDIERLLGALPGYTCEFEGMGLRPDEASSLTMGLGIFTRLPVRARTARYYLGAPDAQLPETFQRDSATYNNFHRMTLFLDVEKEGATYRIGTTHFTWTPDGKADERQRRELELLLSSLSAAGEFALCGDFNAPRGGEIFTKLAEAYTDNIPPQYTTSIDGSLHRAGPLELMVDGLFTTPAYTARDVRLQGGVSDHMAIVATIEKTQ